MASSKTLRSEFDKLWPEVFELVPLLLRLQAVRTAVEKTRHRREYVNRVTHDDNHLLRFELPFEEGPRVVGLRDPDQVVIADRLFSNQAHRLGMYGEIDWHV